MTPIVVDASVVAKWFVQEEHRDEALQLLDRPLPLAAPDFLLTELASILWKKCIRDEITAEQAREIPPLVAPAFAELVPAPELLDAALELALQLQHSVYDCMYLACAAKVGGLLVTADQRFLAKTRIGRFSTIVRYVTDAPRAADLADLPISLETLGTLAGLAETSGRTISGIIKPEGVGAGIQIDRIPLAQKIPSPNHLKFRRALEKLSADELSCVVRLIELGGGPIRYDLGLETEPVSDLECLLGLLLTTQQVASHLNLGLERFLNGRL